MTFTQNIELEKKGKEEEKEEDRSYKENIESIKYLTRNT